MCNALKEQQYKKFMPYNDANKVVGELFDLLTLRHQDSIETSMRGSEFTFDSVQLMYCKCHK